MLLVAAADFFMLLFFEALELVCAMILVGLVGFMASRNRETKEPRVWKRQYGDRNTPRGLCVVCTTVRQNTREPVLPFAHPWPKTCQST